MTRFRDADPRYCGEEYPESVFAPFVDSRGATGKIRLDRWCYPQPPGHEGPHRTIDGREWQ